MRLHLLLLSLCLVWESVTAQCQFPTESNSVGIAASFGTSFFALFQVECLADGPELNTYRSSVIYVEFTDNPVASALVEAACDSSEEWIRVGFEEIQRVNVSLLPGPCSNCSVSSGQSVCQHALPPAIFVSVDGLVFRTAGQNNYYIFDPLQGSSSDLSIECGFEGSSQEMDQLQSNSFWKVDFDNSTFNSLVQTTPLEANLTDINIVLGSVIVSFIAANASYASIEFDPNFNNELIGLYQCHSSVGFPVQSPVSVNIIDDNPFLEYTGESVLNLVFPVTTFNVSGLVAEYRFNGVQKIAGTNLKTYYNSGSDRIDGTIESLDSETRTYRIKFTESIPAVVDIVIELDLYSELGVARNVNFTVNSHGIFILPSQRVETLVGSDVTLTCLSRVPNNGASVSWTISEGSVVTLSSVENVIENSEICCEVLDVPSYPSEAETELCITLLVYPSPVSIRQSQQIVFFPQPSIYNPGFLETDFSVTCNGLSGNGGLQWTTDYEGFGPDLSQISSEFGSVTSSNPNELTLTISTDAYSSVVGNFTCTSMESGLSASVYLPGMSRYISLLEYPQTPVSIGQEVSIDVLAARFGNGEISTSLVEIEMFAGELTTSLQSRDNPFTFGFDFTVSSQMNTTFSIVLGDGEGMVELPLIVRAAPEIAVVSVAPFRFVARQPVNLRCSTSDSNGVISWLNADNSDLVPPMYNVSQSSDGISTLTLIAYIYDLSYFRYPPDSLMLSDIGDIDSFSWTQITSDRDVVCTVCDLNTFTSSCSDATLIDPQVLIIEPLFHDVTWVSPNSQLYNASIINFNLGSVKLTCKATKSNGDLALRTDNEVLNQFLATLGGGGNFTYSENTTISVNILGDYDLEFEVIGIFEPPLSGLYTCYSRNSGVETSVLLTTDTDYLAFLVPSPVTYTLGTSVFIPFRSASGTNGDPSQSRSNDLGFFGPEGSIVNLYEVSPYNYGLYLDTLRSTDGGNYTVEILEDGPSRAIQTVLVEIEYPTIAGYANVTIRQGENATLSCVPSDPNVQLVWSIYPPTAFSILPLPASDNVMYDTNLRHSLTLTNPPPSQDETYYCYVEGDLDDRNVSPGMVTLDVRARCDRVLTAGILFDTSFQGDIISVPCRNVSQKFINSANVKLYRECGLPIQLSTCTLAADTTDVFAVLDFTVIADNVSVVMAKEQDILSEVRAALGGNTSQITDLYVTRYIPYDSKVGIVAEAIFNPVYARSFFFVGLPGEVIAGFVLNSFFFNGFEPSDICECQPSIAQQIFVPIEPQRREVERPFVQLFGSVFERVCVGVSVEPCICGDTSCECQLPFVGDGEQCTIDSDSDGYPDTAIQSLTCNVTIANPQPNYCFNDTCPRTYNPEQNPPVCEIIIPDGCVVDSDPVYGIQWPSTPVNTTAIQACGGANVVGLSTRYCESNGDWLPVNASECVSRDFLEVASSLVATTPDFLNTSDLLIATGSVRTVINQLSVITTDTDRDQVSLFPSELSISNDVVSLSISILIEDINRNGNSSNINESAFGDVFSNLLDVRNDGAWNSLQVDNPSMGSELLLDNAEDFGLLLASSLEQEEFVVVSRDNIVIAATLLTRQAGGQIPSIIFPDPGKGLGEELNGASIEIPSELLQERITEGGTLPVVNIIFNNLQEFLETSNSNSTLETGSLIISSQVGKQSGTADLSTSLLNDPVTISLSILSENFSNPSCVFWEFSTPIGNGFWSSSGVDTVYDEDTRLVVCQSQHLTSFAVLVDTTGVTSTLTPEESLALSIVTYIGLAISIVCLILTVIFFLTFGKTLFSSVHNFIHLNLALSLLLAYIVFISGIETATGNKAACTIVAALLHYFFLSAFCWMLCEALMLYLMLVVVFSTLSKKWWFFLLLGWLPPLIPVVITVGITHDYYTDGEHFCWLSVEKNVIWSFIIPVIVIILINLVFFVMVLFSLIKNRGSKNAAMKLEENHRIDIVKTTLKASLILLPLLGLTWVFGFLAIVQQTSFFAWIFTILNAFQGAAIFFFHVVRNDRIWGRITKKYSQLSSKSGEYSTSEHPSDARGEKKKKYFSSKATGSSVAGSYSKNNEYELAPVTASHDEQEKDIEKEEPIGGEYVQVGSDPGSDDGGEIKVGLNKHEDAPDGTQEHSLRYTIKSDPAAPLELVENV